MCTRELYRTWLARTNQLAFKMRFVALLTLVSAGLARAAVTSQPYIWKNVKIGGGGGFVPGIIFNPSEKGLAFARLEVHANLN